MDSTEVSAVVLISPSNMSRMESLDKTRSGGATSSGVDIGEELLFATAAAAATLSSTGFGAPSVPKEKRSAISSSSHPSSDIVLIKINCNSIQ